MGAAAILDLDGGRHTCGQANFISSYYSSRSVDAGADFISYYQSSIVRLIDVHIDICICMLVLPTSKFKRLQLTPLAMGAKFASDRNP